ncbi:Two-component sensor histidine kinase [Pseudomonas syringae pv. actinidiae]|uniref:Two-component sensor histidine kinase n=1 Tax=Pseudomonas syringae pv. actinidiae TaxID=103796 RepID=A0A2V0QBY1_PSESF|nr:Two-component sensor histidine kinase [Pseudomonas syringae pv. actinidiae]
MAVSSVFWRNGKFLQLERSHNYTNIAQCPPCARRYLTVQSESEDVGWLSLFMSEKLRVCWVSLESQIRQLSCHLKHL